MKTALVFPPQWYPSQPYLAMPALSAYLQSKGHEVDCFDFNVESYDIFLTKDYLTQCVDKIRQRLASQAQTRKEHEVKQIYLQILSDAEYLESILSGVEEAKGVLRNEEKFFQFPVYKSAYTTLKAAMKPPLPLSPPAAAAGALPRLLKRATNIPDAPF